MDSIPWEKAQLAAEEKPLHYGKTIRTFERTSRCALDWKGLLDFRS